MSCAENSAWRASWQGKRQCSRRSSGRCCWPGRACALTLHALRRFALDGGLTEAALGALRALARYCAGALMAMLLLSAALAVLNMLLAWAGLGLGSVSFPVSALIFCFAALLGARFAAAHKRLRDKNDMFI